MSIGFLKTKVGSVLPGREDRKPLFADAHDSLSSEIDAIAGLWLDRARAVIADLPTTAELLTHGGDGRIACESRGSNRYGCSAFPEPDLLAFGSCTASTISPAGFKAADALRRRLRDAALSEPAPVTYDRELGRLRRELSALCGLESVPGLEIIFAASGTDLHLFASQLMVDSCAPAPLIIRVEAAETGRGVPDALAGHHFSDSSALGDSVTPSSPLDCGRPVEILEVKCRTHAGSLRPVEIIDAEVEQAALKAVQAGRRVLITLVDVSKTGLLAPSPACASALQRRFPELIEVFVDACQFRLAPSTLKAYLEHDFLVAITGSKFVTGPTFCGALFVPKESARRLKAQTFPRALRSYSTRADWPRDWAARTSLRNVENYGLLLRWEAALAELRAFRELPDEAIRNFLEVFAQAVTDHLADSPALELVPALTPDRGPIAPAKSWDHLPTIFPFVLSRRSSAGKQICLNPDETKRIHELLREDLGHRSASHVAVRCQTGQPVACGTRDGVPLSALRLCASTRLIVDALSEKGRGTEAVIAEALAVLDKAAFLASLPLT